VGGLIGNGFGANIQNCYSVGGVTANDPGQNATRVGGLIGSLQSSGSLSNSIAFGASVYCSHYYGDTTGSATNRVLGYKDGTSTISGLYAKTTMSVNCQYSGSNVDSIVAGAGNADGSNIDALTGTGSAPMSNWEFNSDGDADKVYWKLDGGTNRPVLYVDPESDGTFTKLGTDNGM
jgi:hypothetical protein